MTLNEVIEHRLKLAKEDYKARRISLETLQYTAKHLTSILLLNNDLTKPLKG